MPHKIISAFLSPPSSSGFLRHEEPGRASSNQGNERYPFMAHVPLNNKKDFYVIKIGKEIKPRNPGLGVAGRRNPVRTGLDSDV
jgi:hypothetical protein